MVIPSLPDVLYSSKIFREICLFTILSFHRTCLFLFFCIYYNRQTSEEPEVPLWACERIVDVVPLICTGLCSKW